MEADPKVPPLIITHCLNHLKATALREEGLFRVSGVPAEVSSLRKSFESGEAPGLGYVSKHSVATVFKRYLIELPIPLIPFMFQPQIVDVFGSYRLRSERVQHYKNLLQFLPPSHQLVLKELCLFLNLLSKNSDKNLMSTINLGICWGPTLMRGEPVEVSMSEVEANQKSVEVVTDLIELATDVWE